MDIQTLNSKYELLSPKQRIEELFNDFDEKKILFTSSFGTSAILLLHMFHSVKPEHPVHFIDTSYHFMETLAFKQNLKRSYNINVIDVHPEPWKNKFTLEDQTWSKNPDFCCSINKVEPLDAIKKNFDVWVSGLMAHQNTNRGSLDIFQEKKDILKFHPIIDMPMEDIQLYTQNNSLPEHPLLNHGYDSVGCTHCTKIGQGRAGRWDGFAKTECGLHT